jgi:hypothetical protein
MTDVVSQLEKIDFLTLSSAEKSQVASVLLKKIPDITGLIQAASKDKERQTGYKLSELKKAIVNGTCDTEKVENFIKELSEQYTFLLSQVGFIENQLIQAEEMKNKIQDSVQGIKIATLPTVFLIDFVRVLKESKWAKIIWDEKNGTKVNNITDYARLIDIYIEPNILWSEQVTFKMLMGGYLPESEYNQLQKKTPLRLEPYNM